MDSRIMQLVSGFLHVDVILTLAFILMLIIFLIKVITTIVSTNKWAKELDLKEAKERRLPSTIIQRSLGNNFAEATNIDINALDIKIEKVRQSVNIEEWLQIRQNILTLCNDLQKRRDKFHEIKSLLEKPAFDKCFLSIRQTQYNLVKVINDLYAQHSQPDIDIILGLKSIEDNPDNSGNLNNASKSVESNELKEILI